MGLLVQIGILVAIVICGCTAKGSDMQPSALAKAATAPAVQPTGKLSPADIKRFQQYFLDSPDWQGPLSAMLKVRVEADTWGELVAKVKPTITWGQFQDKPMPDCGFPDMMWIEDGPDGKPIFRLARAYTWKPAGQKVRCILVDCLDIPSDELALRQVAGHSMPATVRVVPEKSHDDHPASYAIAKSSHPRGGTVYEVGWEVQMSAGSGHWENLRLLYIWHDATGKWRLIGEGPEEKQGKLGGGHCFGAEIESTVYWRGDPIRPIVSLVQSERDSEAGDGEIGLPSRTVCRDAVLDATSDILPTMFKWSEQEYIVAAKDDTLEKIIYRLAIWQVEDGWEPYQYPDPDAKLLQKRERIRQKYRNELLRLNPKLAQTGTEAIPEGTRVIISTRVPAAAPASQQSPEPASAPAGGIGKKQ